MNPQAGSNDYEHQPRAHPPRPTPLKQALVYPYTPPESVRTNLKRRRQSQDSTTNTPPTQHRNAPNPSNQTSHYSSIVPLDRLNYGPPVYQKAFHGDMSRTPFAPHALPNPYPTPPQQYSGSHLRSQQTPDQYGQRQQYHDIPPPPPPNPTSNPISNPILSSLSSHSVTAQLGTMGLNSLRSPSPSVRRTHLILGASRGIGLEFVRQLLLDRSNQVIAVVRNPESANLLWQLMAYSDSHGGRPGACVMSQCDVGDSNSIDVFIERMSRLVRQGTVFDTIVCNAGILEYEKGIGALNVSFEDLVRCLTVNCVGNVVCARRLLELNELSPLGPMTAAQEGMRNVIGRQIIFISSDSASMADFREYEDGFASYGASKAALNMMVRHMAAELRKRAQEKRVHQERIELAQEMRRVWESEVCVLCMHPGEVATDMAANVELSWDVEGVIGVEESVRCMLRVLSERTVRDSGTFWRWDNTQHPW